MPPRRWRTRRTRRTIGDRAASARNRIRDTDINLLEYIARVEAPRLAFIRSLQSGSIRNLSYGHPRRQRARRNWARIRRFVRSGS